MRAWHVESLPVASALFEAEEEFLEWLFSRFLGLSDDRDTVRIAVAAHLSVQVGAEPVPKKAEAPVGGAVGGGGAYQPESSPFVDPDRPG